MSCAGGTSPGRADAKKNNCPRVSRRRRERSIAGATFAHGRRRMRGPQPQLRASCCAARDRGTARERAHYLDEACYGKTELRQRVEALLRAHEEASGFLQE